MNEGEETLVNGLTNHFSAGHKFGVKLVKNVLQIVSLDGLFRVEELKEFLHELGRNVDLERSNFNGFIYNQLKEELVDTLEMRPGGLNFILLLDTSFRELEVGLLEVWQRSENVLLNHGHHIVKMRNNQRNNRLLILKHLLDFVDSVQPFGLALNILGLVFVVEVLLADQKLLLETLFGVLIGGACSLSILARIACTSRLGGSSSCRFASLRRLLGLLHSYLIIIIF
jgi:hypothetical protein